MPRITSTIYKSFGSQQAYDAWRGGYWRDAVLIDSRHRFAVTRSGLYAPLSFRICRSPSAIFKSKRHWRMLGFDAMVSEMVRAFSVAARRDACWHGWFGRKPACRSDGRFQGGELFDETAAAMEFCSSENQTRCAARTGSWHVSIQTLDGISSGACAFWCLPDASRFHVMHLRPRASHHLAPRICAA